MNRDPMDTATSAEKRFGYKTNIKKVWIFGCQAFVHIPNQKLSKMDAQK